MTGFDERWEETEVHTVSPNEQIFVVVRGDRDVRVSFAPGYYERARRDQLIEQLQRTARVAFLDRTNAFFDLISRDRGTTVRPSRSIVNARDADYWRRLDELEVSAGTPGGELSATLLGSQHLSVTIAPGVMERHSAESFAAIASQVATELLRDHLAKAMQIKLDVYLPGHRR